jgi:hypothetical protein
MSEEKKGVVIRTNGKVERIMIGGLSDMQEVVGGNIEVATSGGKYGERWDLWANEEGRLLALPMNPIARQFIADMLGCELDEILSMHGDFLLLGLDDHEGVSTDCPEHIADMALAMSMFDDVSIGFTTYTMNEDGEIEETHEVL